ncbi:MAG: lipopolysaccharide biosynthesis protein [Proteobacteria bacterium]|nr:lipopolysaccharide biosynthesis protein [Pseudomonadota bacterium]
MFFRKKAQAGAPQPAPKPLPRPAMAPASPAIDLGGEPDLRSIGRMLWLKKTMIFGVTFFAAAAAFLVVNAMTPRYQSEARLLLESRENVFMRADADKGLTDRGTIDQEAVTSQIQLVLSRDVAREVIKKEHLDKLREFDPAVGGQSIGQMLLGMIGLGRDLASMSPEERTLAAYYDRVNAYAIEKSRVIGVDFKSSDPDVAARVANAIAEAYLASQRSAKTDQTRAASSWLAGEIEKMRAKVADAEAKVEAYRSQSNLFVGTNNTSLPNQQLTEINSQIAAARGQKADLEARAKQLHELVRSGKPVDSSDIANSESMRRLTDQGAALRAQLAEQSTTLLDQHPRIKELRAQIAEVERAKRAEADRLARQLDNDAKVAADRLAALTASLDQVKKVASTTNEQDVQLRALERDAKSQRDILESYLVKYSEASARDNVSAAPPEARIISRATPAIQPTYPKKLPTILIAAFAGLALSTGFVVTGALLGSSAGAGVPAYAYAPVGYATPDFADPHAPLPISTVPAMGMPPLPHVASPPLMPQMKPAAAFAAPMPPLPVSTIEQIAQSLRHAGEAGRRVTVAGTARNAGTTYAAITLARTLADGASVVLVDFAFGAPNLSVISTDPNAPGIAELVRGQVNFGDIITRDQYSQVHVVATGTVGNDAAALAASPYLSTIVEALAQSYNYVVVDAGSVADAPVDYFARLAQRSVLVTADPADVKTRSARERMAMAGFGDVVLLAGATQASVA